MKRIVEIKANQYNYGLWFRPYKCQYCKERFRHQIAFKDHIKENHDLDLRISRPETERNRKRLQVPLVLPDHSSSLTVRRWKKQ